MAGAFAFAATPGLLLVKKIKKGDVFDSPETI
jgi:hypothetical protein